MSNKSTLDDYKSPLKKLVKFFSLSRDKWKARSHEKQKRIDFLETKVKDLTNSRNYWKNKAKILKSSTLSCQPDNATINAEIGTDKELSTVENTNPSSNSYRQKNLSRSDRKSLLPIDEIIAQYGGRDDINILPHPSGTAILIPGGFLPWERAYGHLYLLFIQELSIRMVLEAHTSLRGAMKCLELFAQLIPIKIPSWVTIQNWLLRFGLHQLQIQLPRRTDWIWLCDATIKIGKNKCLLIVGTTQAQLSKHGFNLCHKDVQVLKMEVVSQLNGEIIFNYLEELSSLIGIPQQIVSDHGSDFKKGIELFCHFHRKPKYTYDITHKTALLLKAILEPCSTWQNLLEQCRVTRQQVKQTNQAFLMPPKSQKNKSRYMNLDDLIKWAFQMIDYQEKGDFSLISTEHSIDELVLSQLRTTGYDLVANDLEPLLGQNYPNKSALFQAIIQTNVQNPLEVQLMIYSIADLGFRAFQQNFGWINDFRHVIADYHQLMIVIKLANTQVKLKGLNSQSFQEFQLQIKNHQITSEMAQVLAQEITDFLKSEGQLLKTRPILIRSQTGLGSSDVIESIWGKFKEFIKGVNDLGKMALTIPAFLGNITVGGIKQALESVHQQDVEDWIADSIGQSTLSKRTIAFHKPEQNQSEKNVGQSVPI